MNNDDDGTDGFYEVDDEPRHDVAIGLFIAALVIIGMIFSYLK